MVRLQRQILLQQAVKKVRAARLERDPDEEPSATIIVNLSRVLALLEEGRRKRDPEGLLVIGEEGITRRVIFVCPPDPDEETSEVIRGPWLGSLEDPAPAAQPTEALEEATQMISRNWLEKLESRPRRPRDPLEEPSELIQGPWQPVSPSKVEEEETCFYDAEELRALLAGTALARESR